MPLIILSLSYFTIMFAGGGLWQPGQQAVTVALSLASLVQMLQAIKKRRLAPGAFIWPTLLLFGCLSLFLIPLDSLQQWFISAERAAVNSQMAATLQEAFAGGLLTEFQISSPLSLNYWGTLRFFTTVFLFANVLYLVSSLSRQHKIYLVYVLLSGAFIVAGAGMIEEFLYSNKGKMWWSMDFGGNAVKACFGLTNHYGVYLCFFLPFCLLFAKRSWTKDNKFFCALWLLLYIWFFIGLWVSFSRGAYALALLVSIAILFCGRVDAAKKTVAALAAFTIILLFSWLVPERLEKEFKQDFHETGRVELYEIAPEIISSYPHGIGPLAYRFISTTYLVKDKGRRHLAHHSESTTFQYIQEWGILPFLVWLSILTAFVMIAIDCKKRGRLSRRLAAPAMIALLAAVLHGQYDFPSSIPIYCFTMACLAGLLLSKGENYDPGIHRSWKRLQSSLALLLPLSALLFYATLFYNDGEELFRDKYSYTAERSLQELAELLPQQATSWHTWMWMGKLAWKEGELAFSEICFENAARYFPNHSHMWDYLAKVRYLQGKPKEAARAFRMYYLMQPSWKRKKETQQAAAFFQISQQEVEKLYYIKLKKSELTKNFIDSI